MPLLFLRLFLVLVLVLVLVIVIVLVLVLVLVLLLRRVLLQFAFSSFSVQFSAYNMSRSQAS